MVSASSTSRNYHPWPYAKRQERAMVAFTRFQTPLKTGIEAISASPGLSNLALAARRRYSDWMIWTALACVLATGAVLPTGPALPQAGVQLIKVDLSVVTKGYRMSKLIGSNVINDKNEKIGTVDDVVADKEKKQLSFAVLQVGGFLGLGGRVVGVPYDTLAMQRHG